MPRRRNLLIGIGAAATASAVGAGSFLTTDRAAASTSTTSSEDDGPARVRVVHASPDAPAVDILVDGETVLTGLSFRSVSDYLGLDPGNYTVAIRATGDSDTVVFEGQVEVAAGTDYTVAAIGELTEDSFRARVLEDRNRELPDTVAEVRVVHASPDAPAVDIATEHDRHIAGDIFFGQIGHYRVFFAEDTTIQVTPAGADSESDPVFETTLPLEGGNTYTLFATGYLTPGDDPSDEPFGLVPAVGGPRPETARVRGVHAVPDAPNVDVFIDDEKAFSKVHFGTVTQYRTLPAGTYQAKVTAAGSPDTVVFEGEVEVAAGSDYTVAALGELSEGTARPALLTDTADIGDGQAGVRVVHASPDAPAVDVTTAGSAQTLVDGLSFGTVAGPLELAPGEYMLEVKPDSRTNDNPFDAEFDVQLEADRLYTLFAAGYFTADDEPGKNQFTLLPGVTELTE